MMMLSNIFLKLFKIDFHKEITLIYHGIPRKKNSFIDSKIFENQLIYLKNKFNIISSKEINNKKRHSNKIDIILTFDDGFKNNSTIVAPLLKKYGIPATFFIATRHSEKGKYLWKTHLNILEKRFTGNGFMFRGKYMDMTKSSRRETINNLSLMLLNYENHPHKMYRVLENELPTPDDLLNQNEIDDWVAGMTSEQIKELGKEKLFDIQVHTIDHPILTKCSKDEQIRQIKYNKIYLENLVGKTCSEIAYPFGEYSGDILSNIKKLNFKKGYAVVSKYDIKSPYEIPRIGIYRKNILYLLLKIYFSDIMEEYRINNF